MLAPTSILVARAHFFKIRFARLVRDAKHVAFVCKMGQCRNHRFINRTRALRSAEDEQRKARSIAPFRRNVKELAAHWIAGHNSLAAKVRKRGLERHSRAVNKTRERAIGKTRQS